MPSKNPNNHASRFKPQDDVAKVRLQPIGAKLPPELDEIVRGIQNRSAFVRRAITNQLISEGYLAATKSILDVAIEPDPEPATKKTRARKTKTNEN